MRLNGWQRIGIVVSVAWAIGAAIYQRNADVERAESFAKYAYKVCAESEAIAHRNNLERCDKENKEHIDAFMVGSWGNVAFMALVPIPCAWLACIVLITVGRAQLTGFRSVLPWGALTVPKKAFVIFSTLATGAVVLFAVIVVLNLYADTEVPVALAPSVMVLKTGNDLVSARGTWIRSGFAAGSELAYPLQTSWIECHRQERRCTEARASVSGNLMSAELVEYEVESWTPTAIVFKNDTFCATEVFTIDLRTESVNGAGHRVNEDLEFCKRFPVQEQPWNYRLAEGFKVYWELRQKARPLPLRVFHSFFGH